MNDKKALVISGGGSKGAFGGGQAQYLIQTMGREYDMLLGTSTGNLLTPLLAINRIKKLRRGYTTVTQKDIFKVNPFKIKNNKKGLVKYGINHFSVLYNILIRGQKTFGDSSNLRKLIPQFFTINDYNEILEQNKDVISCVTNITLDKAEYKSIKECSYEDFCDWLWVSANVPPFMTLYEKEGSEYADGGVKEHVPIQEAINRGATDIDVIILRPKEREVDVEKIRNPFHLMTRIIEILINEVSKDDVKIGKLMGNGKDISLNIYYTPRVLTNNSLLFDQKIMNDWWDEGYNYMKHIVEPNRILKISKRGKISEIK